MATAIPPRRRPLTVALLLAGLAGLLVALLPAAPASAHASLVETAPADREQLDQAPETVTLTFDEAIDAVTDGVRVFDTDGERIDQGLTDTGEATEVAAALPDELADGGYVATYRIVSEDGHTIEGAFAFSVGDGGGVADATVAELFGGGAGWTGVAGPALRGIGYLGTPAVAGAAVFGAVVARRPEDRRRARRLAVPAAWAGLGVTLLAIGVQAVAVTGRSPLDALRPDALGSVLTSSFGASGLVRVLALGAGVVAWRRVAAPAGNATGSATAGDATADRSSRVGAPLAATLAAGGAALASYLLDGHQVTSEPAWLLLSADAVHLAGAATWLGGLVLLAWAVRSRRRGDDPSGAARLVARFSSVALVSVVALGLAGAAMSWALVRTPQALISTGYGLTLVAKVAVVALVVAVAAYNRWRLVPAITARVVPAGASIDAPTVTETSRSPQARTAVRARAAWRQLRITLVAEVVGVVVVALLTGFLVSQQPAADAAGVTGAYQTTQELTDDLDVELVVDPNQVGANAMHVYVLDDTGRPAQDVEDLEVELTYVPESIGPFDVETYPAGPGHWAADLDQLTYPGTWEVDISAAVGDFDEAATTIPVTVNE